MGTLDQFFVCPECHHGMKAANGNYRCQGCDRSFPIVQGIGRFVDPSNYAQSFGYQWLLHARTQLDSATKLPISQNRFFTVTGWPRKMEGELILEAGCGAGRFTEIVLSTGARVMSFDYSQAVEANFSNNGAHPNLTLFQGDINHIPLKPGIFDKIFCLGVLQHTPNPERSFRSLLPFLKPGGSIVIDIYKKHWQTYLKTKYWLRPITKRIGNERLFKIVKRIVPPLLKAQDILRRFVGGKLAFGLIPVSPANSAGLSPEQRIEWSILDTFDMYSPRHDHPRSIDEVKRWFKEAGFDEATVAYGPNGIIARGKSPQINSFSKVA